MTLYDLPEGSGRRFLFGLFGRDHDEPGCEKDGCVDCAIIVHFEREMGEQKRKYSDLLQSHYSLCGKIEYLKEESGKLAANAEMIARWVDEKDAKLQESERRIIEMEKDYEIARRGLSYILHGAKDARTMYDAAQDAMAKIRPIGGFVDKRICEETFALRKCEKEAKHGGRHRSDDGFEWARP